MILLNDQKDKGWWGDDNKGSSLSGTIESTAYAIMGLIHAFPEDELVIKAVSKAMNYILNQRRASGWISTRDTLYASWAIGEAGKILWKPKSSVVTIIINESIFRSFSYDPSEVNSLDMLYQMREVFADILNHGNNVIAVKSSGIEANIMFEIKKYYAEGVWQSLKAKTDITADWDQHQYKVGQDACLTVNVSPKEKLDALMVEIPIPAGFLLVTLSDISPSGKEWHKEWNENSKKIACFISKLEDGTDITVKLTALLPGKMIANPCRAFEMYHPDDVAVSAMRTLEIT